MLQGNPHKLMLKTEVQGEGKDRVVVKLNEIRSSDLVAGEGETLQIVDDVITVAPRPPRAPVLGAVKKYTFHKRLKALGKWEAFNSEIKKTAEIKDLYDNSHELDINDPDAIALSPLIKQAVGVTDAEYDSLFEV
tara:strand:- start:3582 stop:3986 length:405 start_codon:yes stop_codon:yes gene_type:complete